MTVSRSPDPCAAVPVASNARAPDPQAKRRRMVRLLVALGLTATLGGCIFVPVGGPGYYRPHPRYYYY